MALTAAHIDALSTTPVMEYARAENVRREAAGTPFFLIEDPEFYARMGITTAAEWLVYCLHCDYSDLYKEAHGFRPRGRGPTTAEDLIAAVEDLERYIADCAAMEAAEAAAEEARVAAAMRIEPLTHRPFASLGR